MNRLLLPMLAAFAVAPLVAAPAAPAADAAPFAVIRPSFPPVVFHAGPAPAGFSATGGGRAEVTDTLFKSETGHALRFSWDRPGAALVWKHPEAFRHMTGANPDPIVYQRCLYTVLSTFKVWVFNEKPVDDVVWFEVGAEGRTDARFHLKLNFTGWRRLAALYGRDIRAMPRADADTLRILAPASVARGALTFDLLEPRTEEDPRQVPRTEEAPWVKNLAAARAGGGLCTDPAIANMATAKPALVTIPEPASLDASQQAALRALTEKFMARFAPPVTPRTLSPREVESVREAYAKHAIVRQGRWVSGQVINARQVWRDINLVAEAWAESSANPALREELRQKAFDLIDLVTLQGHPIWYGANAGFVRPVRLMRAELAATGRLEPFLNKFRELYVLEDFLHVEARADADALNTWFHGQIGVILLAEDGPAKWRDLLALQRYMNEIADRGEIKPDGSFFHHDMAYSYGIPAIRSLAEALRLLKGSPFFPVRSHESARRVAWAMRFYSCGEDMPDYIGGRWRGSCVVDASLYRDLAECGEPGSDAPVDREMAAYYLWFDRKDADSARYAAMGIRPAQPAGNLTLPYSVASFQRRGDWMVGVHGQKKQFRAAEAYAAQNANPMGRYLAFGQTFIHSRREAPGKRVTAKASGIETDKGWDYNRWPGTTARVFPYEALRSHFEVEEMTTAEGYAGGVSLDGNGLFAMKLREDLPGASSPLRIGPSRWWLGEAEYGKRVADSCYDPAFRARKSWFFFDDCTVCLGGGITAGDGRFPINTTLFQNALNAPHKRARFTLGGESGSVFPLDLNRAASDRSHWLMDSNDTGYWVPPGNDALRLLRSERALPYPPYWLHDHVKFSLPGLVAEYAAKNAVIAPNAGETELAWFDHGLPGGAPAGYEYAILVDTTPEAMRRFAAAPRYRVLRKDAVAHVVADAPTRSVGYAVFETGESPAAPGADAFAPAVTAVSKPCMLMLRRTDAGAVRLSFADPDPNLTPLRGPDGGHLEWGRPGAGAVPTHTRVTLAGRWRVSGAGASVIAADAAGTVIDIACVESAPVVVDLLPEPR